MFGRRAKHEDARVQVQAAWSQLRGDLDAVAAAPADAARWVALALRWAELATLPPTHRQARGLHLGFTQRADGTLQDCALAERALRLIDQLLAAGHDPARLIPAREQLLAARPVSTAPANEVELARIAERARTIAGSVQRIVPYARPVVWMHPVDAPPQAPEPRLVYLGAQLRLDGFAQLGWIENSWFNTLFSQRVLTAAWAPPTADLIVAGGVVGGIEAIDVETWLSDGRFLTTTASRGRNMFGGGPWEDALHVDTAVAIDELIALHRARLRMLLATTPNLAVWPVTTAAHFAEMQEALRQRKAEFRLAEGLSESEALGMAPEHPELAVPLLRQEAQRACAAAAAMAHAQAA
jgi:hypothetical protein